MREQAKRCPRGMPGEEQRSASHPISVATCHSDWSEESTSANPEYILESRAFPGRLMVGRRTLNPSIQVRILAWEPCIYAFCTRLMLTNGITI